MTTTGTDRLVQLVQRVENATELDRADAALRPFASALVADAQRRSLLRGEWFGHGIHPVLTDLPLGMWLSASVLDVIGGKGGRKASRRLIGLGILSSMPTAITGLAEWAGVSERRDRRTGVAHAALNSMALMAYVASWRARHQDKNLKGMGLSTLGGLFAVAGSYLGGHLSEVRKISTSHPAFQVDHAFDPPEDSLEARIERDFNEGHSEF